MAERVDTLSENLGSLGEKANELSIGRNTADKQVEELSSGLHTMDQKVEGLSTNLNTINKRIEELSKSLNSKIDSVANNNKNILSLENIEIISETDKQKIARELQVRQINAASDSQMKQVYYREKAFFLDKIDMNKEDDRPLTEDELKQINEFWSRYSFAYKNNPETQRFFSRVSGRFDPSYVSWELQYNILKTFWECSGFRMLNSKNHFALMFPDIPKPKTYVMYGWGQYYDGDRNVIAKDEAADILYNISKTERILVKPSGGVCGNGISSIAIGTSKEEILKMFDGYNEGFICQEFIENHSSHNVSKALNTLRVVTLYHNGKFSWVGSLLRMAVTSDIVDNFHQGGIACPVDENGVCGNYAFSLDGKRYSEHPNGFKFAGHKLHNYEKAHELALKLHKNFPFVKLISWDIAINKNGEPKVLEFGNPGDSTIIQCGGFNVYIDKEIMKAVLDQCLIRNFFYRKATFDWNYREYRDSITLEKYAGFDTIVKVPESINGKKITFILSGAVKDPKIKEIYIPNSVKLGNNAITVTNAKIITF